MTRRLTTVVLTLGAVTVWAAPQEYPVLSNWQDTLRNLRHPNVEVRLEAVQKLGQAAYVPAAEPIAPLITDADDRVQAAALEAELTFFLTERLSTIRVLGVGSSKSRAQMAFDGGPLIRSATAAPPLLVQKLIDAMRDENARVRYDAVHALGFIAEAPLGSGEARRLADELDHYDPLIRTATARVVGRLHVKEAGDRLLAALGDSDSLVRLYATDALGLIQEPRAAAPLRDMLTRGRADAAGPATLALARLASPDDRARFRQQLTSRDILTRRAAIEGLGRLGDTGSLASVDQIFKTDRTPTVRLASAFALQLLGQTQTHVIASMLATDETAVQARDYLLELGHAALPGVESALKASTDSRHRAVLIQLVGYIGERQDQALLEPFVTDRDARVVRAAANAIARLVR